ncbi:MAG TPA: ABC transporter ATP-binding protein [Nitrospirae bacterium]|nr:ABC transporter ATP-binding protein [Nitrospirota bacterium]
MNIIEFKDLSIRYRLSRARPKTVQEYFLSLFKKNIQSYEDFWALKDISFSIQKGENTGIIGQNGAGKSTLLKVVAGVIAPSEGTVSIKGKVAPLIELGAGFDMDLTGEENIYLNGSILGLSNREIKKRIDSIIEFSELKDFIYAPIRTFSSGMISRLAFSIAISIDADILIVDEVLSVGDEVFRQKCKEKINELIKKGTTLLFVSHNTTDVINLCERALWLQQGRLLFDGDSEIVSRRYLYGENTKIFEDVDEGHKYKESIDKLFLNGFANGEVINGKRYFMPDRQITRGEFATFVGRILGVKKDFKIKAIFEDVKESHWSARYIYFLYQSGHIKKNQKGRNMFMPEGTITISEIRDILTSINNSGSFTLLRDLDDSATISRGELSVLLVDFFKLKDK